MLMLNINILKKKKLYKCNIITFRDHSWILKSSSGWRAGSEVCAVRCQCLSFWGTHDWEIASLLKCHSTGENTRWAERRRRRRRRRDGEEESGKMERVIARPSGSPTWTETDLVWWTRHKDPLKTPDTFFLMLIYFLLKTYPKAHPITFSLHNKQQTKFRFQRIWQNRNLHMPRMMSSITSARFTGEEKHFLGYIFKFCHFSSTSAYIHALKTKKFIKWGVSFLHYSFPYWGFWIDES